MDKNKSTDTPFPEDVSQPAPSPGNSGQKARELIIAKKELAYQNKEKEKRADELTIANKEL
ncbi:MAG: hypothetical protein ABIN95_08685, partial [Mucilaginibacter sp.]